MLFEIIATNFFCYYRRLCSTHQKAKGYLIFASIVKKHVYTCTSIEEGVNMSASSELFAQLVKKQPVATKRKKVNKKNGDDTQKSNVQKNDKTSNDINSDNDMAIKNGTNDQATKKEEKHDVKENKVDDLTEDGLSKIVAARIASQFPLLSSNPNVHAVDNATKAFAVAGTGKYIYWDKKVNYYRSQRLKPAREYDQLQKRGQDTPFTWPMLLPASELGDEFNVGTLLRKSVVLPPEEKTLNASIVRASREGHLHVVKMLLNYGRGASPNAIDLIDERAKYSNRKYVALHEAAKAGHDNVVSALLDRVSKYNTIFQTLLVETFSNIVCMFSNTFPIHTLLSTGG